MNYEGEFLQLMLLEEFPHIFPYLIQWLTATYANYARNVSSNNEAMFLNECIWRDNNDVKND